VLAQQQGTQIAQTQKAEHEKNKLAGQCYILYRHQYCISTAEWFSIITNIQPWTVLREEKVQVSTSKGILAFFPPQVASPLGRPYSFFLLAFMYQVAILTLNTLGALILKIE
jgi:hypothetical protein